MYIQISQIIDL